MNSQPESHQKWCAENPEKLAEYSKRHREKESAKQKQRAWVIANREKVLAAAKRWREKNRKKQRAACAAWRKKNRAYINEKDRERCAKDPAYKLGRQLRNRIRGAVKDQSATKSAASAKLTGCDIQFLMGYLEARFKPGMKWSNYGTVWEIDHRIPCASFDLTDESHQRSCFHYSNLQPLFRQHNREKHATLPGTHQAELI